MRITPKPAPGSSPRKEAPFTPAADGSCRVDESGEVDVIDVLRAFTVTLKLAGLNLSTPRAPLTAETRSSCGVKAKRALEYVISGAMILWTAFIVYMFFNTFKVKGFTQVELCFLACVVSVSVAALAITLTMSVKQSRLRQLIVVMNELSRLVWRYRPRVTRRLRRGAIAYVCLPLLISVTCLVIGLVVIAGERHVIFGPGFDLYMVQITYSDCDITGDPSCYSKTVNQVVLVGLMWSCTVFSLYWFCIGLILFTYYLLFLMLDSLERKFASHSPVYTGDDNHNHDQDTPADEQEEAGEGQELVDRDARRFIRLHKQLCSIVHRANDCFQELNFALSFVEILITIFMLRGMDFRSQERINVDKLLMPTIFMVVSFALRAIMASKVNDQVFASMKSLLKIKPTPINDCPSAETTMKIHQYVKFIEMTPPCLTGWGLYKVTDDSILTIAGYILTYTLTLYGIG